jgi:predicted nucleotidyltransferase component of viral defense system
MFTKTLLPDTLRAIKLVSKIPEIKKAYLAGGTALALQIGHRISVDLDFFTQEQFDAKELSTKLVKYPEFAQAGTAEQTVWGTIGETKFSIFHYEYPLLEQTELFEGLQLASLADIAAMKIHAIEDRGTRRDFVDVYFLSKKYTFEDMLNYYQKKYSVLEDHLYSILRSLDYFEDAEKETQMPNMLTDVFWKDVKKFFNKEAQKLIKNKL